MDHSARGVGGNSEAAKLDTEAHPRPNRGVERGGWNRGAERGVSGVWGGDWTGTLPLFLPLSLRSPFTLPPLPLPQARTAPAEQQSQWGVSLAPPGTDEKLADPRLMAAIRRQHGR